MWSQPLLKTKTLEKHTAQAGPGSNLVSSIMWSLWIIVLLFHGLLAQEIVTICESVTYTDTLTFTNYTTIFETGVDGVGLTGNTTSSSSISSMSTTGGGTGLLSSASSTTENDLPTSTTSLPASTVSTNPEVTQSTFYITFSQPVSRRSLNKRQTGTLLYLAFDTDNLSILVTSQGLAAQFSLGNQGLQSGTLFVAFNNSSGQLRFTLQISPPPVPVTVNIDDNGSVSVPGAAGFCTSNGALNVITDETNASDSCQTVAPALLATDATTDASTTSISSDISTTAATGTGASTSSDAATDVAGTTSMTETTFTSSGVLLSSSETISSFSNITTSSTGNMTATSTIPGSSSSCYPFIHTSVPSPLSACSGHIGVMAYPITPDLCYLYLCGQRLAGPYTTLDLPAQRYGPDYCLQSCTTNSDCAGTVFVSNYTGFGPDPGQSGQCYIYTQLTGGEPLFIEGQNFLRKDSCEDVRAYVGCPTTTSKATSMSSTATIPQVTYITMQTCSGSDGTSTCEITVIASTILSNGAGAGSVATSSTSTSSVLSTSVSTAQASPTCVNGAIVVSNDGYQYQTLCSIGNAYGWDHFASYSDAYSLGDCIARCDADPNCNAVSIEYRSGANNLCGFIYTSYEFEGYPFDSDTAIRISGPNARVQIDQSTSSSSISSTSSITSTTSMSATSTQPSSQPAQTFCDAPDATACPFAGCGSCAILPGHPSSDHLCASGGYCVPCDSDDDCVAAGAIAGLPEYQICAQMAGCVSEDGHTGNACLYFDQTTCPNIPVASTTSSTTTAPAPTPTDSCDPTSAGSAHAGCPDSCGSCAVPAGGSNDDAFCTPGVQCKPCNVDDDCGVDSGYLCVSFLYCTEEEGYIGNGCATPQNAYVDANCPIFPPKGATTTSTAAVSTTASVSGA